MEMEPTDRVAEKRGALQHSIGRTSNAQIAPSRERVEPALALPPSCHLQRGTYVTPPGLAKRSDDMGLYIHSRRHRCNGTCRRHGRYFCGLAAFEVRPSCSLCLHPLARGRDHDFTGCFHGTEVHVAQSEWT